MISLPSYLNFDNSKYYWKKEIEYRLNPFLYKVGKGEQGVLICEPYKSEILPFWKFKTPETAKQSCTKVFDLFLKYLENEDFVGADMARKFLQMGFTRSRRYFNYKGGKKYNSQDNYKLMEKGTGDKQKAVSAQYFFDKWKEAENNEKYKKLKKDWKYKYG
jgi:hypothetical protein